VQLCVAGVPDDYLGTAKSEIEERDGRSLRRGHDLGFAEDEVSGGVKNFHDPAEVGSGHRYFSLMVLLSSQS